MPKTSTAVTCKVCHKMHPENGAYILVDATIQEHKSQQLEGGPLLAYDYKRREAQSIKVEDTVVCNNECLMSLLSLKGF